MDEYLKKVAKIYERGNATEHSYRRALAKCMEGLMGGCVATNEPKRTEFGSPDYIIEKEMHGKQGELGKPLKPLPMGYVEAKDIGAKLSRIEKEEQLMRYRKGFSNFVLTDYLEFRFYRKGEKQDTVRIAEIKDGRIIPQRKNFPTLERLFTNFRGFDDEAIGTWQELTERMADAGKLIRDEVFARAFAKDSHSNIKEQLTGFRKFLIHDMEAPQFVDIYTQTIVYGLFTARLHDETLSDFSREEARDLIPLSNPFLRQLFDYVCGANFDKNLVWVLDYLCKIYRDVDLHALIKSFSKRTSTNDPLIHFYETFLGQYNPELRKSRGVYYTPEPVVNFIVRAMDDCLKKYFDLPEGLAHRGKVDIFAEAATAKKAKIKKSVHKVQLLDVATGTGSFMAEVIRQIHDSSFKNQQGAWSNYVEEHLLPRLHGFELMMASYAMCHLKLDFLLTETGYKPQNKSNPPRLGVYLTNALEEAHPDYDTLFAQWLSNESNEASRIKRDMPVMVTFGNPPYSGVSANMDIKNPIIDIEPYKHVNGEHFGERKHWLHDDYVKFIRLAEHYIEKNKEGILAYITNHAYLDNPTFRGMRWHLLQTFDDIYILDLHGNASRQEKAPDGSADKNVFDIRQGVAAIIAVKHGKRKGKLAQVHHADLWGSRQSKYDALAQSTLKSIQWEKIKNRKPYYFFVPKDIKGEDEYKKGFSVEEIFPKNVTGVVTMGDNFIVSENRESLKERLENFILENKTEKQLKESFSLGKNYAKWIVEKRKQIKIDKTKFIKFNYRPLDIRWTYFDNKLIWRWREKIMRHFLSRENVGLITVKSVSEKKSFSHTLITRLISEGHMGNNISYLFPLYLYDESESRKPNLNMGIVEEMARKLKLPFIADHKARGASKKRQEQTAFSPLDLLDYIYAVLHSPTYREKYKAFLKIDFPRIPYPKTAKRFWRLADLGGEIRALHLMEHKALANRTIGFPIEGDDQVEKPRFSDDGKVWINKNQYFNHVPQTAWEFYIGGYQPAQKWLKDRKGRKLSYDDIAHYQKIIIALAETHRIMDEINKIA